MSDHSEASAALLSLRKQIDEVLPLNDPAERMKGCMFVQELARQAAKFQRRAWLGSPERQADGQGGLFDRSGDDDDDDDETTPAGRAARSEDREPVRT